MATAAPTPITRPPSPLLAFTELPRALSEFGLLIPSAPWLYSVPRGDGHPVLVLPGFTTTDASTTVLRRYLTRLGYDAHTWDLGRNLGPRAIGREGEKLAARLAAIHEATGRKVSLVGWSLGGVMARMVSRVQPDAVRQVISLGSPFTGSPRSTNVWRAYELLTGQRIDDAATKEQLRESATPPPVPSTAIWSREDGIVAWQNCVEPFSENSDNIEVHGSHCGLGVNPAVLYAVADRLSLPEYGWRPFNREGVRAWFYPSAGHA
ncbi:esterase/lipase family protein [Sphingomonas corticis]|jgi:pimeloyl-ACP methyl ester carboxylesterase|uniref:Alpha/beta hydrolase n=1 Tax=Sphingomonas corticis TaxID=2722791 RepID=A0ABX1CGS4_9SPHN|nr:alpha/beta hydrolase [Sphingomonas corticis]NJR77209.1 alpha/beta hydrolase [Sphingomonas corticis]